MTLHISSDMEACDALTHSGIFHSDEVMATAILSHCGVRNVGRVAALPDCVPQNAVVYDIGGGAYDHHQAGGNGSRENGVPYSCCGLIWRDFGPRVCKTLLGDGCKDAFNEVWSSVDSSLIQPIDMVDNGRHAYDSAGISRMISDYRPRWNCDEDMDTAFLRAVSFADTVLTNRILAAGAAAEAKSIVTAALSGAEGGVLRLDRYVPWLGALNDANVEREEILFVVFPSLRGGYQCQCVPLKGDSFGQKCPFPRSWRGQPQETLRALTGVSTALFCHPAGFLCGAETMEDAVRLARLAIDSIGKEG